VLLVGGAKVTLIEEAHHGWGLPECRLCTIETIIRSSRVYADIRMPKRFGIRVLAAPGKISCCNGADAAAARKINHGKLYDLISTVGRGCIFWARLTLWS